MLRLLLLCLTLLSICHRIDCLSSISYRTGRPSDVWIISTTLARQLMNPLGMDATNFIVATDSTDRLIGWAQIRSLGSSLKNPNQYDAPPGSYSAEQDYDDDVWLELDDIEIPSGWESLPWTKEYREFSNQAKERRERRENMMQAQTRQAENDSLLWELASVYVRPEYRHQGIGSELVLKCLQRHVQQKRQLVDRVYLLTLSTRAPWYASGFGFCLVDDLSEIPSAMQFEVAAGTVITKLIGEELCCLRATPETLACVMDRRAVSKANMEP